MSEKLNSKMAVIGIDIGKNSFHVVGQDRRGALVLRQKWSRGQVEARLANLPPCLIGMEACTGAHHLSRKLQALGHNARLMPAKYVRPYCKGDKNDYRDAEAIAEAVQRPTMKFVATKTADQLDLQALHLASDWSVSAPASSIRSARSCWSAGLRCAKGCASCGPSYQTSWPSAPTCSRLAYCASSRTFPETGAGWMSASRASPARSKHWPGKTRAARD